MISSVEKPRLGLVENAGMRIYGYSDMRVHRTGLTNRFQKLINTS